MGAGTRDAPRARMRKLLYVTALAIAGAVGCAQVADAPPAELQGMPVPPDENDEMIADIDRLEHPTFAADPTPTICAMLPTDGSACAHACDPGALQAFIPEGTCVTFDCPLTDGTTVRVGGCSL